VRQTASSQECRSALVFLWAVAEATFWPVMPDAVIVPFAMARPDNWWRSALGATLGSTLGGALSYGIGRRVATNELACRLPLVRPSMVKAAGCWLHKEGARGLRRQPLSGIPFKVFALLGSGSQVSCGSFLAWAAFARGSRFLVVSAGAALIGQRFSTVVSRHARPLLALWAFAFLAGLWQSVRGWEQRAV
jgi:1-acyl-sn-glycerol-3-phosphate acyltransferase